MSTENPSEAKQRSAVRERLRKDRAERQPRPDRPPPPPSPTRKIEPGLVHYQIAGGILKGVQDRVREKTGSELDIGELPSVTAQSEADDPEKLAKITARIVARIGDRFTFLRRVNRHLEGTDSRSGILSDCFAALVTLYKRNPETVEALAHDFRNDLSSRRAKPKTPTNNGSHNQGVKDNAQA